MEYETLQTLAERVKERRVALLKCIRLLVEETGIDGYTLKKINGALGAPIIDCPTPFNHQISLLININAAILSWWDDEEEKEEVHIVDLEEAYGLQEVTPSVARVILEDGWMWKGQYVPQSTLNTISVLHREKMIPAGKLIFHCLWDHFISYLKIQVADDYTARDIYFATHPYDPTLPPYLLIPERKIEGIVEEINRR